VRFWSFFELACGGGGVSSWFELAVVSEWRA
jgi:hypothetical protein